MAGQRVSENIKGENIWETESTKTKEARDTGKNRTTLRFKSINREQINAFCMCFYFLTNIFLRFACLLAFFSISVPCFSLSLVQHQFLIANFST